ncbi:MAG: tryptophan--tRNA ligase [Anaplasmataceae bacterium]|nr:tryptophan--tRNA ligase [Anaplasmataceae bacterium]
MNNDIVFSGIQPTGLVHLGNYLGAIKNWVKLQDDNSIKQNIFCVVDLHAKTNFNDLLISSQNLRDKSLDTIAALLACGLNEEKSDIFIQSDITGHLELFWILSCIIPASWLNKMTQFKDKIKKGNLANLALYSYPVLMAADIILYGATSVPVGNDQVQHIELTHDLIDKINSIIGEDIIKKPKILMIDNARIMSLKDSSNKMSKSDISDQSRINIIDSDEIIIKKIKKAKSDIIDGFNYEELDSRSEAKNLLNIYAELSNKKLKDICLEFQNSNFANFKKELIEVIINHLTPIRKKYYELYNDKKLLEIIATKKILNLSNLASNNLKLFKNKLNIL